MRMMRLSISLYITQNTCVWFKAFLIYTSPYLLSIHIVFIQSCCCLEFLLLLSSIYMRLALTLTLCVVGAIFFCWWCSVMLVIVAFRCLLSFYFTSVLLSNATSDAATRFAWLFIFSMLVFFFSTFLYFCFCFVSSFFLFLNPPLCLFCCHWW